MKSEYQKMIAGEPYHPFDPELRALAQTARQKQAAFNEEVDPVKGLEIIKGWFGSTGENLYVNTRLVVELLVQGLPLVCFAKWLVKVCLKKKPINASLW